jgi:hypothetical protein
MRCGGPSAASLFPTLIYAVLRYGKAKKVL